MRQALRQVARGARDGVPPSRLGARATRRLPPPTPASPSLGEQNRSAYPGANPRRILKLVPSLSGCSRPCSALWCETSERRSLMGMISGLLCLCSLFGREALYAERTTLLFPLIAGRERGTETASLSAYPLILPIRARRFDGPATSNLPLSLSFSPYYVTCTFRHRILRVLIPSCSCFKKNKIKELRAQHQDYGNDR